MDYGKSVSSLNSRGLSNARDSLSGTGKASLSLTLRWFSVTRFDYNGA